MELDWFWRRIGRLCLGVLSLCKNGAKLVVSLCLNYLFKSPINNYMTKLVLILCAINTIAILFLCWNAYMQIESSGDMWNMFQDFERLLIDILQGRITETESV